VLLPINDDLTPYATTLRDTMALAGLRVHLDDRTESLNKKVREAQLDKTPLILTIGGKEKEAGTLSVRTLDGKVAYGVGQQAFMDRVADHIAKRVLEPITF
jgi:threonyl-tRNA synthetase